MLWAKTYNKIICYPLHKTKLLQVTARQGLSCPQVPVSPPGSSLSSWIPAHRCFKLREPGHYLAHRHSAEAFVIPFHSSFVHDHDQTRVHHTTVTPPVTRYACEHPIRWSDRPHPTTKWRPLLLCEDIRSLLHAQMCVPLFVFNHMMCVRTVLTSEPMDGVPLGLYWMSSTIESRYHADI